MIIFQLVHAVSICYRSGVGHRDCKLQNITFPVQKDEAYRETVQVKLADFGMAGFVGPDNKLRGR